MATTVFNFPSTLDRIEAKLNALAFAVTTLQAGQAALSQQGVKVMAALDDLEAKVAEVEGAAQSAIMLIDTIHQELVDALASGDMGRLRALKDKLEMDRQALADAVARNPDPNMAQPQP